jgi:DNA-binding transcriptional ArsR family regulator
MRTPTSPTAADGRAECIDAAVVADTPALASYAKVFKALSDETRLCILEKLARAGGAQCACQVETCCDLAQPTISHHLKVLREAGLIVGERRGTWIYYSINREAVAALPEVLERLAG